MGRFELADMRAMQDVLGHNDGSTTMTTRMSWIRVPTE